MSDSMGYAVYKAAKDGKEAELTRLIGLGGNVNWRDGVRRRMCLAWAPASSPPLLLSPPRSPETAPVPTARCTARAAALAAPPPRRPAELGTRVLVAWRAPHPRVLAHAPRVLWHSMTPRVLHLPKAGDTALIVATYNGREGCVRLLLAAEAIEVNAKVSLEHALPQHMRWVRFHVIIPLGLSFVFRTTTIGQHCITRHTGATSRSPSAFSKGAPIRRFETVSARRPSTTHGIMAGARSWRSSASLGTPRACTLIAQRCRADVQRRRLGRTRTTGFRPLGERMAANRHGMRPRGRSAPPMGPHGESRSHILKILGRSPHGPLPRAVVGTSGVGGGLAAWFATRRGCDWPRRPRHTLLPLPLTALPSSRPPFASPRAS
jgi:hypothetical protein